MHGMYEMYRFQPIYPKNPMHPINPGWRHAHTNVELAGAARKEIEKLKSA